MVKNLLLKKLIPPELEHKGEMGNIKDRMLLPKLKEYLGDEKNLRFLEAKPGIPEIRRKNEEMRKQLSELSGNS